MSRFQFVADTGTPARRMWLCTVMEIARSSFYAWLAAADDRNARTAADEALADRIRVVTNTDSAYGEPRITAELERVGARIGAGRPQAGRSGDAHRRDRRPPAETPGEDHCVGSGRHEGARSAQPGFHRPSTEHQMRR